MTRDLMPSLATTFVFAALPLLLGGCVCPPCAAGAAAPGAAPAAAAAGGGDAAASTPLAEGGMIWNGEGAGAAAKGWADCDKKPDCKATLDPLPGVGKDGSVGLKFVGEGPGFVGFGWNWFGWYPETAGTDVSAQKQLSFWVKIVPASAELAPDLGGVTVSLGCSKDKKNSASVPFSEIAKDALDGQWHKVSVPLAALQKGDGKDLDLKTVWEFRIGTWAASPRKFEIHVDDIAFEK
jgi:hypothetical protein